ncbi:MAG: DNA polymerase III subunit gamma/tau [Deltaproteobacteria bacterium]|nr:MAG: DNA polymerase III subunit gamma/tau [Deltaproteobacteria bacterium]
MTTPYLVLARKYRPQRFQDLTGQEHVVRTLVNALKTGRVAHAFLFTGPRGCGKTTSARILARALNCEKGPTSEPCGVCGPCVDIAAGTDVDVQEIDAASNNGVDDVRALREAAKYVPARDRYKIYIVDEVHMLSGAAFNALLKTLEEPPGHIKFLLATTDPQKLPATILSRVQRHNIQLVPLGKIVARLREIAEAEKVQVSDGALTLVARQAQGSMRDALSLLDQLFSAHDPAAGEIGDGEAAETLGALDTSAVRDIVKGVLARDASAALAGVARAWEQGADMKRLGEELASHARNLVLASLAGVKQDLPDHEIRAFAQQAAEHDPAQLARVFELLQLAEDEIAKASNPRHALEVALLRAVHLAPAGSLPDLVARIEALGTDTPVAKPAEPRKAPPGWGARVLAPDAAPLRAAPTPPPAADPEPEAEPAAERPLDLNARWRLLLDSVRAARKPGAAAALEHAIPVKIDRSAVQVAFRKGSGQAAIVQEARAAVEGAFEKALGFRAPLQIVEQDAPADDSVAEQKQKQRAAASEGRIALAREHPAVRAAVEVLGGEIEDVRDLGEE